MVVKPIINLATKYTDDIVGLGVRKWTKPTTFEGLSYAEEIIGDTFIRTTKNFLEQIRQSTKTTIKFKYKGFFNLAKKTNEYKNLIDEMDISLDCISNKELVKKIKTLGDYFSCEELSKMDELCRLGMNIDDVIFCRGDITKLGILTDKIRPKSLEEIKHYIKDYVNKLDVFKHNDESSNYECTKQINAFISSQKNFLIDDILYRGELSEYQINRLLKLILEKQSNPEKIIKYTPGHLFSTTNNLESLTHIFDYADKCFIKIIGISGKCKGVDVNDLLKTQNKFFNQNEILLSSTSEFEVIEGFVENGRLIITMKFLK